MSVVVMLFGVCVLQIGAGALAGWLMRSGAARRDAAELRAALQAQGQLRYEAGRQDGRAEGQAMMMGMLTGGTPE